MQAAFFVVLAAAACVYALVSPPAPGPAAAAPTAAATPALQPTLSPKIAFDLSRLNADGLVGPPDGLRSLAYEFCIPSDSEAEAEVKAIDPTIQLMPSSRGRIGCTARQTLAVGQTHQPNFRDVLNRLAALPYVKRIQETDFE